MYAHFACGFVKNGIVHGRTEELLRKLARRNGWFVPVSTLLDFLRAERSAECIPSKELTSMEHRWALDKAALLTGRVLSARETWDYQPPKLVNAHDS